MKTFTKAMQKTQDGVFNLMKVQYTSVVPLVETDPTPYPISNGQIKALLDEIEMLRVEVATLRACNPEIHVYNRAIDEAEVKYGIIIE